MPIASKENCYIANTGGSFTGRYEDVSFYKTICILAKADGEDVLKVYLKNKGHDHDNDHDHDHDYDCQTHHINHRSKTITIDIHGAELFRISVNNSAKSVYYVTFSTTHNCIEWKKKSHHKSCHKSWQPEKSCLKVCDEETHHLLKKIDGHVKDISDDTSQIVTNTDNVENILTQIDNDTSQIVTNTQDIENILTNISGCGFGTTNYDAFGRLRVSEPFTLFDSYNRYNKNDVKFIQYTNPNGSITSPDVSSTSQVYLSVTGTGGEAVRESKYVFQYQPGKSLLVMNTFVMPSTPTPSSDCVRKVGYFLTNVGTSNPCGIYFKNDSTGNSFVIEDGRGNTTSVPQSNWNGNRLNGVGTNLPNGCYSNTDFVD